MKLFYRLEEAISSIESTSDLAVFSKEYGVQGKRHYLVGPRADFWDSYKNQSPKNHYEVILSGTPCKLFFDLEFDISLNKSTDRVELTRTLISLVIENLKIEFGRRISLNDVCILDSTSEIKFSKHIIFISCVFIDCEMCGNYVKNMLSNLTLEQKQQLTVSNKKKQEVLIIDQSVYTKNRNFRLFLSSKFGRNVALKVVDVDSNEEQKHFQCEKNIFFQSLITNIPTEVDIIVYSDEQYSVKPKKLEERSENQTTNKSPFPEFDKFVTSLIAPGKIEKVIVHENKNTNMPVMIYNVSGYNYCKNINRCHEKNNIFFVANIINRHIVQRCHDANCATFYSDPIVMNIDKVEFDESDNPDLLLASIEY